jgi:hypothetical protein
MAEVALKIVPQEEEVSREVLNINAQAKELKVATTEDYIKGGEFWKSIKALRKKVDDTFSPIISAAHAAHKTAVAKKKEVDAPLEEAERRVKRLMADYDAEQERIRREAQRRLEEQARKQAEEQALLDAIAAEEAGEKEEVAAIIEEPVYVAPVVIPKATPKLAGGRCTEQSRNSEFLMKALSLVNTSYPTWLRSGCCSGIKKTGQYTGNRSLRGTSLIGVMPCCTRLMIIPVFPVSDRKTGQSVPPGELSTPPATLGRGNGNHRRISKERT